MSSPDFGDISFAAPWAPVAAALLFACSLALQLFCAWVRTLVVLPVIWLMLLGLGWAPGAYPVALAVGFVPLLASVLTLALPWRGWWWQAGGRSPSAVEREAYAEALAQLRRANPAIRGPRSWLVSDVDGLRAEVYGETLMLTRGLLASGWLTPVLAHELGHVNSFDGRLAASLWRMTTPPRRRLAFPWRAIGFLATGEAAAWLLRSPWAHYWALREFAADAHAVALGEGANLAAFLPCGGLERDLPAPFPWLCERSHPSTEQRIERLLQIDQQEDRE